MTGLYEHNNQIKNETLKEWDDDIKRFGEKYGKVLSLWGSISGQVCDHINKFDNHYYHSISKGNNPFEMELCVCGMICLVCFEHNFNSATIKYFERHKEFVTGDIAWRLFDSVSFDLKDVVISLEEAPVEHKRIKGAKLSDYMAVHANIIRNRLFAKAS